MKSNQFPSEYRRSWELLDILTPQHDEQLLHLEFHIVTEISNPPDIQVEGDQKCQECQR